jgi:transcriptional regulator with XRE-family HTH domain
MKTRELLGARIKELRKTKGLTQDQLSEIIDIDAKHLSRIEVGRSYPSLDLLEKTAVALRVELKDFFEYEHLVKSSTDLQKGIQALLQEADTEKLQMILKIVRTIVR